MIFYCLQALRNQSKFLNKWEVSKTCPEALKQSLGKLQI